MTTILWIRAKQSFRLLKHLGTGRTIVLMLGISIGILYVSLVKAEFLLLFSILLLFLHRKRKDAVFLRLQPVNSYWIYLTEYAFLAFPIILILLLRQEWLLSLGLLSFLFLISSIPLGYPRLTWINLKNRRLNHSWIPIQLFEWRSELRKNGWLIIISYLLGIVLSPFVLTLPILVFYWTTILASVFNPVEAKEIKEELLAVQKALIHRLIRHSIFFHLLFLPHFGLFLLFHGSYWQIALFIFLYTQLIITFNLFYKYANWHHDRRFINNQLPGFVFSVLSIVLFPIGFLITMKYWIAAKKSLNA